MLMLESLLSDVISTFPCTLGERCMHFLFFFLCAPRFINSTEVKLKERQRKMKGSMQKYVFFFSF